MLELMIAVTILSGILLAIALVLQSTGEVATIEAARNEIERANQDALDRMALDLRDSAVRVTQVAANGSSVRFQIPVDLNGNNTVLDNAGIIEFGFVDAAGAPQAGTITYRFVQGVRGGQPDVLDEAALRVDFNNDGDITDRYSRGYLVRVTQVTGGPELVNPVRVGIWVAQRDGALGADITGDGQPDPIFQMDAANNRLLVNLWGIHLDENKNRHFVRSSSSIFLRNR